MKGGREGGKCALSAAYMQATLDPSHMNHVLTCTIQLQAIVLSLILGISWASFYHPIPSIRPSFSLQDSVFRVLRTPLGRSALFLPRCSYSCRSTPVGCLILT